MGRDRRTSLAHWQRMDAGPILEALANTRENEDFQSAPGAVEGSMTAVLRRKICLASVLSLTEGVVWLEHRSRTDMGTASAFMISPSFPKLQFRYSPSQGWLSLLQAPTALLHQVAEMQTSGRQGHSAFL